MKKGNKLLCSMLLILAIIIQSFGLIMPNVAVANTTYSNGVVSETQSNYGLPENTQEGVILHAFDWSFNTIKSNLAEIAAAGYKAVQTSIVQPSKEDNASMWYMLYQPIDWTIGNQLGTEREFNLMCLEAEKYGIDIIVDVIFNHTGNNGQGQDKVPSYRVNPVIKNNPNFWHTYMGNINYKDRWQVTHGCVGLPDLATENYDLQNNIFFPFVLKLIQNGADGLRVDTAKHIALPEDNFNPTDYFWPRLLSVINTVDSNSFVYGEVLQSGDRDINTNKYTDGFEDYAKYINLTASNYGYSVRNAIRDRNVGLAIVSDYGGRGVNPSKLVTWVESHDTYLNSDGDSINMSQWQVEMGWAIVAARAQGTPLFFNRPTDKKGGAATIGKVGDNHWNDKDVVAVNKFHNAMIGQNEYLRQINNNVLMIDRGTKGTVILSLDGNVTLNSQSTNLANGTYVDQTGTNGTFTVSSGKISGTVKSGTIAVLYNADNKPEIKVHYYKPSDWGTPNIYYYDETVIPKKEGSAWPGTAMNSEGDGWYSYTIKDWNKANVIFNSNGKQIPASGQTGYLITKECWIKDGVITYEKPGTGTVPVTFVVNNATTTLGQNIYIVGNIKELGNWSPDKAVGPAVCPNYPTWTVTIDLPAGETIEFKAIKKNSSGSVEWQSGSNRTYTIPSSGAGTVTISW